MLQALQVIIFYDFFFYLCDFVFHLTGSHHRFLSDCQDQSAEFMVRSCRKENDSSSTISSLPANRYCESSPR